MRSANWPDHGAPKARIWPRLELAGGLPVPSPGSAASSRNAPPARSRRHARPALRTALSPLVSAASAPVQPRFDSSAYAGSTYRRTGLPRAKSRGRARLRKACQITHPRLRSSGIAWRRRFCRSRHRERKPDKGISTEWRRQRPGLEAIRTHVRSGGSSRTSAGRLPRCGSRGPAMDDGDTPAPRPGFGRNPTSFRLVELDLAGLVVLDLGR